MHTKQVHFIVKAILHLVVSLFCVCCIMDDELCVSCQHCQIVYVLPHLVTLKRLNGTRVLATVDTWTVNIIVWRQTGLLNRRNDWVMPHKQFEMFIICGCWVLCHKNCPLGQTGTDIFSLHGTQECSCWLNEASRTSIDNFVWSKWVKFQCDEEIHKTWS